MMSLMHYSTGCGQGLIIVEGECLILHGLVKNDPEKFKGIPSDV